MEALVRIACLWMLGYGVEGPEFYWCLMSCVDGTSGVAKGVDCSRVDVHIG